MSAAVTVENLSKRYRIGAPRESYRTIRESLAGVWARGFRGPVRRSDTAAGDDSNFWALKDVSFQIQPGEVVGIIGRNGAGKSTLLKILSRITEPTSGRARIRGRVASLLEVGTGFHPELTGRENIYLNGSILGMKKREIRRRFDEIVAFAEIDRFLDTAVKRYSSGMYVRLAFAVAAHLEPEVLIIDEVLAVGDVAFQHKCIGKVRTVATSGRTAILVTHNMSAVRQLCHRGILLDRGGITESGEASAVCDAFVNRASERKPLPYVILSNHPGRRENSDSLLISARLTSSHQLGKKVVTGSPLEVVVQFYSDSPLDMPSLGLAFKDINGQHIFSVNNKFIRGFQLEGGVSQGSICCAITALPLLPGVYDVDIYFGDQFNDYDIIDNAINLEVAESDYFGTGKMPPKGFGAIAQNAKWSFLA